MSKEQQRQEDFLSAAAKSLRAVRKKAGLTQAEVAERLGTKQAAISRLERDVSRASFRRYVDYALACGYVPLELATHAANDLFFRCWYPIFHEANPCVPFTLENVAAWNAHIVRYGNNVLWRKPADIIGS